MGKQDSIAEEDLSMLERGKRNEVRRLQKSLKSATAKGNDYFHDTLIKSIPDLIALLIVDNHLDC